jgi:succinate dehydrogenase/fumarate reductase flavoprotein subunit
LVIGHQVQIRHDPFVNNLSEYWGRSMCADVIVVGAGLAGMTAALAAEKAGADVILVDRGAIGLGTNSALSNAAFSGPVAPERAEEYVELVLQVGKRLNRVAYVRQVAREVSAAVAFVESLGLEIARRPGQWLVRSPQAEVIPGVALVRCVADLVAQQVRIRAERGLYVQELLRSGDRVLGVRGVNLDSGEREVRAPAVILACGGAGAIYARHDNQASMMGQGYRLAASVGLDLWDMEFVQCYPIVLDEPSMPMMMIYPPYPREATLTGPSGDDLLKKHGLGNINQAIVRKRDTFAAVLATEGKVGSVCIDLRAMPEELWEVHPMSLLARFKAECQKRPIRISPAVHFFMGGVPTDEEGQTSLGGLFACGEMVWGLHGANRMAGNALMECLVSGRLAGCSAARWAMAHAGIPCEPEAPMCVEAAAGSLRVDLRHLRQRLQDVAWEHAGVVRSGEGMLTGLRKTDELWHTLRATQIDTQQERILRDDLVSAAFTLRAVLTAGLGRLESRGAFIRSDYPVQDDAQWLRNSRLIWDAASDRFDVRYVPVVAE